MANLASSAPWGRALAVATSAPSGSLAARAAQTEATIAGLQDEITRALAPELDGVRSFALVDFPDHSNVGDSAIYLGELGWLRQRGLSPAYVCSTQSYSAAALYQAVPEGPILIHGGGNFGDIWPQHQALREAVIRDFRGRRIVQLPQTIHFDDNASVDHVAARIAAHGDVLLLVRDRSSYEMARSAFACEVRLCPDLALTLGSIRRPAKAWHDLLLLLRTDKETAKHESIPALPPGAVACDWLDEPENFRKRRRRWSVCRTAFSAPRQAFDLNYQRAELYRGLAAHRVARGLRVLASGRTVISDRLHAHILCLLLGIPHIVFDNNYGKLGSFIDTWTAECDLAGRADGLVEALDCWKAAR
jgi:exopolysaccharide biosynthesis predicted pyruvyltransferase EpsI